MSSQEMRKKIDDRIINLEKEFAKRYQCVSPALEKKCFKARDDEFFRLARIQWANAIVIEHAFSEIEAKKNMFEDGDLFHIEELDEEQMLREMLKEIEDV